MNNLGSLEGEGYRPTPTSGESSVSSLPTEMLQAIFSQLPFDDFFSATLVCRQWKLIALDSVGRRERSRINNFKELLAAHSAIPYLPESWLIPIENLHEEKNYLSLKSSILAVKMEFLFKFYKEVDLEAMRERSLQLDYPLFFENIFELADDLKTADVWRKSDILEEISIKLVTNLAVESSDESSGRADATVQLAVNFALEIGSFAPKIRTLTQISIVLATMGYFDQAVEVAWINNEERDGVQNDFDEYNLYDDAFFEITKRLAKNGQIQQAVAMAEMIDEEFYKETAFRKISKALAGQNHFQEALEFADSIKQEAVKSKALEQISIRLAAIDDFEEALRVANSIDPESKRSSALEQISIRLAAQNHFQEALEFANSINQEAVKSSALEQISTRLAAIGYFEEAIRESLSQSIASHKKSKP